MKNYINHCHSNAITFGRMLSNVTKKPRTPQTTRLINCSDKPNRLLSGGLSTVTGLIIVLQTLRNLLRKHLINESQSHISINLSKNNNSHKAVIKVTNQIFFSPQVGHITRTMHTTNNHSRSDQLPSCERLIHIINE